MSLLLWKMLPLDFYGTSVCLADGRSMPFLSWDAAIEHRECWHMTLASARCNLAKDYSLPPKTAQAAASSELRWWPLRPVVQDIFPAVAWHLGLL